MAKPRLFQDAKKLEEAIEEYFSSTNARNAPLTVTGLANALGTNRMTLLNLEKEDHYAEEFKSLISLAKSRIGQQTEEGLLSGRYNAAGCIFTLKNNWGYKDKTEQEVSVVHSIADSLESRRRRVLENKVISIEEIKTEVH